MDPSSNPLSCQTSSDAGEPLWAHATRVDRWIALGYDGPWESKALAFSELSEPVKRKLMDLQKEEGTNVRVQFIRRPRTDFKNGLPLLLARSDVPSPWLQSLELDGYRDLLDLDLRAMFEGGPTEGRAASPRFLICVNGRRDLCCAQNGQPVYDTLSDLAPDRTWQTTHLGGHRFAATGVVLPYGLHYGRLTPQVTQRLLTATEEGQIVLDHYRGRTIYSGPTQAAAHDLRQEFDLRGINDLHFRGEEQVQEEEWIVRFQIEGQGDPIARVVRPSAEVYRVIKTTGDEEAADVRHFEVLPAA